MKHISSTELSGLSMIWETLYENTAPAGYAREVDIIYFRERLRREGITFLTITLPTLGKALEQSFRTNVFVCPSGFKRRRGTSLPEFLYPAFKALSASRRVRKDALGGAEGVEELPEGQPLIFGEHGEPALLWPSLYGDLAGVVLWIRQLTLMFYKMKLPYEPASVEAVKQAFIDAESEIQSIDWTSVWEKRYDDLTVMRCVISELFRYYRVSDEKPCHGSGSSACKQKPWQRYKVKKFIPRLNEVFPYPEWFMLSDDTCHWTSTLYSLGAEEEPYSRVVYVPKDSRGPRLISMETAEFMYIQQALMRALYRMMERCPYAKHTLSCIDQQRNRDMAQNASSWNTHATIDMKEASDRVSWELVKTLFPDDYVRKLEACRSLGTIFPDGTKVTFAKFAPMGSAVCFPIEAIVFWAASLSASYGYWAPAIVRGSKWALKASPYPTQQSAYADITVYGDDIIVPRASFNDVTSLLEDLGLKTNPTKCFTQGPFRESCGMDAFLGKDVSIIRMNHPLGLDEKGDNIDKAKIRFAEFANNVIRHYGTDLMTEPFRKLFRAIYREDVPVLPSGVAVQGLYLLGDTLHLKNKAREYRGPYMGIREGKKVNYQRSRVKLLCEVPVRIRVNSDDWSHLLRSLLDKGGTEGSSIVIPARLTKTCRKWVDL